MEESELAVDNSEIPLRRLPGVFWVAGSRSGSIRKSIPVISLIDEISHVPEFSTPRLVELEDDYMPDFGGWELSAVGGTRYCCLFK